MSELVALELNVMKQIFCNRDVDFSMAPIALCIEQSVADQREAPTAPDSGRASAVSVVATIGWSVRRW